MKIATLSLMFLSGTCQQIFAFDPVGPPPSSSIARTIRFASFMKVPRVDYPDGSLSEVLDFIRVMEIPVKHGVVIDAEKMNLPASTRVKIVAKDITMLEAVGMIAEQVNADVLIEPGRIHLVPRVNKSTP